MPNRYSGAQGEGWARTNRELKREEALARNKRTEPQRRSTKAEKVLKLAKSIRKANRARDRLDAALKVN